MRRVAVLLALLLVSPCRQRGATPDEFQLPPDPFAALCDSGCDSQPGDPPRVMALRDDLCPGGICERSVLFSSQVQLAQLEVGGEILTKSTKMERWTGDLIVQVYFPWDAAHRCPVTVRPATREFVLRWEKDNPDAWMLERPGGLRHPCTRLRPNGTWSVGSVSG